MLTYSQESYYSGGGGPALGSPVLGLKIFTSWWQTRESDPILKHYERRDLTVCPVCYIVAV